MVEGDRTARETFQPRQEEEELAMRRPSKRSRLRQEPAQGPSSEEAIVAGAREPGRVRRR